MRKLVFGVSDQVQHKPGCATTEDGLKLEISDLSRRGIALFVLQKQMRRSASRYREADMRLCVRICKKAGFLMTRLICSSEILYF